MKRVLVIDSHPLMRAAIRTVVATAWPKAHIVEIGGVEGIDASCRLGAAVDLVVMDPMLPNATGLSALIMVQQNLPSTPIVVFSSRCDDQIIGSSKALGAAAFLHKSVRTVEMMEILRAVATGVRAFPTFNGSVSASHDQAAMRKRLNDLTATQLKVLLRIADGRLNKQVAADLHVSEAAIKGHLTAIFRKLGVYNRAQAMLALRPFLADTTPQHITIAA